MAWTDAAKREDFTAHMQILHGSLESQRSVPSLKIAPIQ